MNPWGTMNDWLRFETEERAARYGHRRPARSARREIRRGIESMIISAAETQPVSALSRDDVTACA